MALYPYEPDTIYPPYNYQHDCVKILDYVAWGDADSAPDAEHPAVQAGLWQAGGVVDPTIDSTGRVVLRDPGRNDRGVYSWANGTLLAAPEPNPVPASNAVALINFSWTGVAGADLYTVEWSTDSRYTVSSITNVSATNIVAVLNDGIWYWRVKAIYGHQSSAFRHGNMFMILAKKVLVHLTKPAAPVVYTNATELPVSYTIWPNEPLRESRIYINGSEAGTATGLYTFTDGSNKVWVDVVTTGELAGTSSTNIYIVDREKPVVTLLTPLDGVLTNLRSVPLYWNATDTYGIRAAEASIDNGGSWAAQSSGEAVVMPDGTNHWSVRAYDYAGNVSIAAPGRVVYIDATAPAVYTNTLISPEGGEILLPGQEFTITWRTNDYRDAHPIERAIWLYLSTNGIEWMVLTNAIANTGTNSWIVPEWVQDRTNCYIKYEARDLLGNAAEDVNDGPFSIIPECSVMGILVAVIVIIKRKTTGWTLF